MGINGILPVIFEDVINMFLVAIHTIIDFYSSLVGFDAKARCRCYITTRQPQ